MVEKVEVELSCGRVAGTGDGGVFRFAGVPYAEAPVGELRFRPPRPKRPWNGVLDASAPSAIAPQLASRLVGVMGDFERTQDEDCLRLTIVTPGLDPARRPVVVWLHGGGFSSGSGGLDWYDGRQLALEGDVVVVGVNYRLGALGYLVADGVSPGNLGLLDQALALRFVRDNVAAFGGDPDDLVLMGQSAGGNSIAALFAGGHDVTGVRRAILQSPALGMAPQRAGEARAAGADFLRALAIGPEDAGAGAAAAAAPVGDVLAAQAAIARGRARYGDTAPPFQLAYGEGLPSAEAFETAAADAMDGVDVLIGVTADEAHAFLARDPRTAELADADAERIALEVYGPAGAGRYARLRQRQPEVPAGALLSRLTSIEVFDRPAFEFAGRRAARGSRVYFYDFAWKPEGSVFESCHCLELPFVFGPSGAWNRAPMLDGGDAGVVAALSATIRAAWLAFARTGRPSAPGLPEWRAFTEEERAVMRLDVSPRLRVLDAVP